MGKAIKLFFIAIIVITLASCAAAKNITVSNGVTIADTPQNYTPVSQAIVKDLPHQADAGIVYKAEKMVGMEPQSDQPVTDEVSSLTAPEDKASYKAEYIADYSDIVGTNTVQIDDNTVVINILDIGYEPTHQVVQMNISATVNGVSKEIHNPFKISNPPVQVGIGGNNTVEDVDSATLESIANVVQTLPNGQATFGTGDPTATIYAYDSSDIVSFEGASLLQISVANGDYTIQGQTEGPSYLTTGGYACSNQLVRGATSFDTGSVLGTGATISSATFGVFGQSKSDTFSAHPNFTLTKFTPSNDNYYVASDFQTNGTPTTRYANELLYSSYSTTGYNNIAFNAQGLSQINKTGKTHIMTRIGNDTDSQDIPIGGCNPAYISGFNYNGIITSGTSSDPFLTIVYTATVADPTTVSLLHFDNSTDNGAIFKDETGKVWFPIGAARTALNQSKFAPSGALFTGVVATNATTIPSTDFDFGTGDFTIDFWENWSTMPNTFASPFSTVHNGDSTGYGVLLSNDGIARFDSSASGSLQPDVITIAGALPAQKYSHIAVVRYGNNLRLYINGTYQAQSTIPVGYVYNSFGHKPMINSFCDDLFTSYQTGGIDELRVTKGLARWTQNFTPPTYPYGLTQANFAPLTQTVPIAPGVANFTDTTPDSTWSNDTYSWAFGDGATSTAQNPQHAYYGVGSYTVTETVTNQNMSSSKSGTVIVGAPAVAFTGTPLTGTTALLVTFTDNTITPPGYPTTTYNMSFGDGTYSALPGPWSHVYTNYGVYDVNLTETNAIGTVFNLKRGYVIVSTNQQQQNTWWTPHTVQITVMDLYGARLYDININANYNQSSMPTEWLNQLYGIQNTAGNSMINNSLIMSGVTGSDGTITFTMLGSLKYNFVLTAPQYSLINYTIFAFPSDSMLNIYVTLPGQALPTGGNNTYVGLNGTRLYFIEPNMSYGSMCIDYQDTSGGTVFLNESWQFKNNNSYIQWINLTNLGTTLLTNCYTMKNVRGTQTWWQYQATRNQ